MNPGCTNLIGSGVVVYVPSFFQELNDLEKKGLPNVRQRIKISDRCHLILNLHQLIDALEEAELGSKSVGTTMKGIGPAYSTKASRNGVRISEIFNESLFEGKMRELAKVAVKRWGDLLKYDVEEEIARFKVSLLSLNPPVFLQVVGINRFLFPLAIPHRP